MGLVSSSLYKRTRSPAEIISHYAWCTTGFRKAEAQLVVAPAEVLDEGVSGNDHSCRAQSFLIASATVGISTVRGRFDPVGIPLDEMTGSGQQLLEYLQVGRPGSRYLAT